MDSNLVKDIFNKKVFEILALYLKDINRAYYGREIARILGMNLKIVQDTLKSLDKAKILKSERKGKTKIYTLNITNPLVRYVLISTEAYKTAKFLERNYEIKKISEILSREVKGVVLIYGSYAKDNPTKDSDIDIAVIGKYNKNTLKEEIMIFPTKVHIIVLKESKMLRGISKNDPFVIEILNNHYVIKGLDKVVDWLIRYGKD